jgi:hypothetical protein
LIKAGIGPGVSARLASAAAAKHFAQYVAQIGTFEFLCPAARSAWAPGSASTSPSKASHGLSAVGIDLATIELRLLGGVSQDVEGRADLLETLFSGRIAGIGVGVELLGELAERLANLVGARTARHAQHLIGITRQEDGPLF